MNRLVPLLLALAACVPLEPAIRHAEVQKAANEGHADDQSLPGAAREIGAANAKAWATQIRYLQGEGE